MKSVLQNKEMLPTLGWVSQREWNAVQSMSGSVNGLQRKPSSSSSSSSPLKIKCVVGKDEKQETSSSSITVPQSMSTSGNQMVNSTMSSSSPLTSSPSPKEDQQVSRDQPIVREKEEKVEIHQDNTVNWHSTSSPSPSEVSSSPLEKESSPKDDVLATSSSIPFDVEQDNKAEIRPESSSTIVNHEVKQSMQVNHSQQQQQSQTQTQATSGVPPLPVLSESSLPTSPTSLGKNITLPTQPLQIRSTVNEETDQQQPQLQTQPLSIAREQEETSTTQTSTCGDSSTNHATAAALNDLSYQDDEHGKTLASMKTEMQVKMEEEEDNEQIQVKRDYMAYTKNQDCMEVAENQPKVIRSLSQASPYDEIPIASGLESNLPKDEIREQPIELVPQKGTRTGGRGKRKSDKAELLSSLPVDSPMDGGEHEEDVYPNANKSRTREDASTKALSQGTEVSDESSSDEGEYPHHPARVGKEYQAVVRPYTSTEKRRYLKTEYHQEVLWNPDRLSHTELDAFVSIFPSDLWEKVFEVIVKCDYDLDKAYTEVWNITVPTLIIS